MCHFLEKWFSMNEPTLLDGWVAQVSTLKTSPIHLARLRSKVSQSVQCVTNQRPLSCDKHRKWLL